MSYATRTPTSSAGPHGGGVGIGMTDDEEVFETAAMLINFILLGKALESAAKGRTSSAIAKLLRLQPL